MCVFFTIVCVCVCRGGRADFVITVLSVHSSFEIILLGKRELTALLKFYSDCYHVCLFVFCVLMFL